MRFPYERFLRFLVSRKVDLSTRLASYDLPRAGDLWEIDTQEKLLSDAPIAVARYLEDEKQKQVGLRAGFLEWADRHGIRELWETQPEFGGESSEDIDTAFKVFVNPHARSAMGLLLLSKADAAGTIQTMLDQFDVEISENCLALYEKIFWDVSLMGRKAWESFVGSLLTKEERNLVGIGLSSPTKEEVRHILGLGAPVDPDTVLHTIMQKAYYRFLHCMEQPNAEEAGSFQWAELAKSCAKTLSNKMGKNTGEEPVPADFGGMFSVRVTRSQHLSLTDIQGEIGTPSDGPKSSEGNE